MKLYIKNAVVPMDSVQRKLSKKNNEYLILRIADEDKEGQYLQVMVSKEAAEDFDFTLYLDEANKVFKFDWVVLTFDPKFKNFIVSKME